MNYIQNDYGKYVIAIGAPGSIARVRVQYPKLIDRLRSLHMQQISYNSFVLDDIITSLIDAGIESKMEVESVIAVTLEIYNHKDLSWKMEEIPSLFLERRFCEHNK